MIKLQLAVIPAVFGALFLFRSLTALVPMTVERIHIANVVDGDTLTIKRDKSAPLKVRLAGIDAPELEQPYGGDARECLQRTLSWAPWHDMVSVGLDKYGRTLAYLYTGDVVVNSALVAQGCAWAYKGGKAFEATEALAKHRNLGVWGTKKPMPPWVWRNGERDK